jgi:uncharacterized protein (DUF2336 family)
MGNATRLSVEDVQRLLDGASADNRAATAVRVAQQIEIEGLSPSERRIAEDIVRLFARDAETKVRKALAEQVKTSAHLPHDVALKLARDVEEVALPVIQFAQVLTDGDLIEIVRSGDAARQDAVAGRAQVSAAVSDEIVEHAQESAVARLAANDGAAISDTAFDRMVARFPGANAVSQALVGRTVLPLRVIEQLFTAVSDSLRQALMARRDIPADTLDEIVLLGRERATIGYIAMGGEADQVESLVRHLHARQRLTPSIVARSIMMGDFTFFAAAMAVRAGITVTAAQILLGDPGPLGLKALYSRAKMPDHLYPAVRAAVDVLVESKYDGEPYDRERFCRRIVERVLTQVDDLGEDTLEFLMTRLARLQTQIKAGSAA